MFLNYEGRRRKGGALKEPEKTRRKMNNPTGWQEKLKYLFEWTSHNQKRETPRLTPFFRVPFNYFARRKSAFSVSHDLGPFYTESKGMLLVRNASAMACCGGGALVATAGISQTVSPDAAL